MIRKIIQIFFTFFLIFILSTRNTYAHLTVIPDEVHVNQPADFTITVHPEKKYPTTSLRLELPPQITAVRPYVKPGWQIEIKKENESDSARVTQIIWQGGTIPSDQKDYFTFTAKTPLKETILLWKVYQTYSDGSVASYDQYNKTTVINTSTNKHPAIYEQIWNKFKINYPAYLSTLSVLLSLITLFFVIKKAGPRSRP